MKVIKVHAFWDEEAKVWVAESDDVPGLATEADTMDNLVKKLQCVIPELLAENQVFDDSPEEIPFQLVSELNAVASRQAC